MTAEEEVRAAWESCDVEDHRWCCGPSEKNLWRAVLEPCWSTWEKSPSDAWQAALAFTRQRQQEIADIEEEIAWMETKFWPNPARNAIPIRILTRLQAQLTELKKGMK